MVWEACSAQLPFDELMKLQAEEEEVLSGLKAPRPERMNSYFMMSAVCVRARVHILFMHPMYVCFCERLCVYLCDYYPAIFACNMDVTECSEWTGQECVRMGSKAKLQ